MALWPFGGRQAVRAQPIPRLIRKVGADTGKYLDDRATESFKRQVDLEEAIWRSLPLFTGALIAGGALITAAGRTLPGPTAAVFPVLTWAAFLGSICAFTTSFFCLWRLVTPRTFQYPADDREIGDYAESMHEYLGGLGMEGDDLDKEVLREMRVYMADAYADAARSALLNNQVRLTWRWRLLNAVLYGFLLAFATDALIFGKRLMTEVAASELYRHVAASDGQPSAHAAEAPHATAASLNPRRRLDQ